MCKYFKTTNNCFGFGYNKPDGTCYLSKPLFDLTTLIQNMLTNIINHILYAIK